MSDLVNPEVNLHAAEYAAQFRAGQPFRHVVIDDFFAPDAAAQFLAEFPPFERGNARTENGTQGLKSTVEALRSIGPTYAALDDLIQTPAFLRLVGQITGIDDLLYDRWYFGGGTHCNRPGQDLDAHVDFNRHPIEGWHRRLNLIVYLNHEWNDAWGGSFELHSDPHAADDRITVVTPLFNRCVIFETTETSWHGFPRINPPPEHRDIARRSIALYFYTKDRPVEELAETHSTIYVERPLPARFAAGLTLSEADAQELHGLVARRDQHLQRLYRDISHLSTQLEQAQAAVYAGKLGRLRYFLQTLRAGARRRG